MLSAAPITLPGDQRELVIRPPGRWPGIGLRELFNYRELLYFLTKRELQVRYKQSIFGVSWAVLQPVSYAFIFALFFGHLAKIPSQGIPYPVFALAGLVPWMFASQAVGMASQSLVADANLLSKVFFPRLVLPVSKVLSYTVDLLIATIVLLGFTFLYGVDWTAGLLLLPFFYGLAGATALAAGLLFSAVNVKYRDLIVATPLIIQLWLFMTPVLYPGTLITGAWAYIYALNPMVSVIEGVRWAFLGTPAPAVGPVAVSCASVLLGMAVGLYYFRRTERFFADVV